LGNRWLKPARRYFVLFSFANGLTLAIVENMTPIAGAIFALAVMLWVIAGGKLKLPFVESEGLLLTRSGRGLLLIGAMTLGGLCCYQILHSSSKVSSQDCSHAKVNGKAEANGQGGTATVAACIDQSGGKR
jgi:hypothetical protein